MDTKSISFNKTEQIELVTNLFYEENDTTKLLDNNAISANSLNSLHQLAPLSYSNSFHDEKKSSWTEGFCFPIILFILLTIFRSFYLFTN